jgi:hypothetical protein
MPAGLDLLSSDEPIRRLRMTEWSWDVTAKPDPNELINVKVLVSQTTLTDERRTRHSGTNLFGSLHGWVVHAVYTTCT